MNSSRALTVASLLSVLLSTVHVADDITRGMAPGKLPSLVLVPILVVWLYGTLVLSGRRSGYVIMLVGGLIGMMLTVLHFMGAGIGASITSSTGGFFFIWTLLAVGTTSLFSFVLALRGLWSTRTPSSH